jgi:hypothetical protein
MSQRTLKLHGGLTAVCLALAAIVPACLGDDTTSVTPSNDSGADHNSAVGGSAPDSSPTGSGGSAGLGGSATGSGGGTGGTGGTTGTGGGTGGVVSTDASDARGPDAGPRDASPDAVVTVDAPSDRSVTPDAPVTPDASVSDATPDRGSDAVATGDGNDGAIPALGLCPAMDAYWNISTDAGGCATQTNPTCGDRGVTGWAADIAQTMLFGDYGADCHVNSMFDAAGMTATTDFLTDDLVPWIVSFFGCPDPTTHYPTADSAYGLVPIPLQSGVFTTADLTLFSSLFETAVINSTTIDAPNPPAGGNIPADQLTAIHNELARLAATLHPVQSNAYTYTSMCPVDDGGTD